VTVDFDKNAYSPGEQIQAKIKVRRPDGERLPVGTSIAYRVAGKEQNGPGLGQGGNLTLDRQGEHTITFAVPDAELEVMTISISTYLGYSQQRGGDSPHVSSHSVPLIDNKMNVDFYPEMTNDGLIPSLPNRLYFQVVSAPVDKLAKVHHVEFSKAQLFGGSTRIGGDIVHIHNGRSFVDFTPVSGQPYSLKVWKTGPSSPQSFPLPAVNDTL
jgi:hypothetical protein